ncbi:MAG: divergent polysaccharide deacetylase family protein [Leptospiraceae bacterium]|nr:divergent polysaccharide deacetylase family protein [Leptospiraceae bacterium]MDW8307329.1 divergent polysaccharide deacetylase family protein [Leptospiraceae bacterium]
MKKARPLFWLLVLLAKGISASESQQLYTKNLPQVANDLLKIWPERQCAYYIGLERGYPMLSMACRGNYSASERRLFLDTLYRHGFFLQEESYKLFPGSGTYLYKTEHSLFADKPIFIKLFLRQSRFLYPQMPVTSPQIALVVLDLYREEDLANWQSLGIPLTYAITPLRQESALLRQKIESYGQDVWLNLRLEPEKLQPSHGKVVTVADVLDQALLEKLSQDLKNSLGDKVTGATYTYGSAFAKNVFAIRSLLSMLRDLSVEYFLNTASFPGFLDTARIMSFRSYQADVMINNKARDLRKDFERAKSIAKKNGYAIVVVEAANKNFFHFLKELLKKKSADKKSVMFLKMREIPADL